MRTDEQRKRDRLYFSELTIGAPMSDDLFGSDAAFPDVRRETADVLKAENERLRQILSATAISVSILLAAKVHDERYHALVQAELAQIKYEAERALK